MRRIFYLNLILLIFVSCKAQKIVEMEQNSTEVIKSNTMEIADYKPFYKIENVWIENDILKIKISFMGNKNIPKFALIWNGALMKSLPPKAVLVLQPNSNTIPTGKRQVNMTLSFDLKPLKETNYNEIVLLIKNYNNQLHYNPIKN
ncbi:MAG: hypothetical protein BWX61_00324 [Bacteroidetes bacterium ADurb.Bin035]|jgi:hypothetical protein|nr:MAG: hypothetical protein BWX61_00324 [Bacteroidetes bacterium ADurb.Bin035]HNT70147.1 hypothetical protein [Bacteroidales bacterium]